MFKLIKENQKIQGILLLIFWGMPVFLLGICVISFYPPTSFVPDYLARQQVKSNQIKIGCLYFSHRGYKAATGYTGFYFKINDIPQSVHTVYLTLRDFPFANKKEAFLEDYLNKINLPLTNEKPRKIHCELVKYVHVKIEFNKKILYQRFFVYDLI